ncbi:hypothetical protein PSN01_01523 [Micromonospora saelicesensis]|nr:hypothetical protein PSN01_01523 [Micromonospora saelicesensis]
MPRGMPSCSARRTWYGPAISEKKYVARGALGANSQRPGAGLAASSALPATIHCGGAVTERVTGALRSGWSKAAKMRGALSRKDSA